MFLEGRGSVVGGTGTSRSPVWAAPPCSSEPDCAASLRPTHSRLGAACPSTPHRPPQLQGNQRCCHDRASIITANCAYICKIKSFK